MLFWLAMLRFQTLGVMRKGAESTSRETLLRSLDPKSDPKKFPHVSRKGCGFVTCTLRYVFLHSNGK